MLLRTFYALNDQRAFVNANNLDANATAVKKELKDVQKFGSIPQFGSLRYGKGLSAYNIRLSIRVFTQLVQALSSTYLQYIES